MNDEKPNKENAVLCIHPSVDLPRAVLRMLTRRGFIVLRCSPDAVKVVDVLPAVAMSLVSRAAFETIANRAGESDGPKTRFGRAVAEAFADAMTPKTAVELAAEVDERLNS